MRNMFKTPKRRELLLYGLLFSLMLFCNLLTRYAVDDYRYYYSFVDYTPLENIWQIFPSMAAHARLMNGRITAHFLVQLFMLVPQWVFDLVNSGMFCLQVAMICKFGFSKDWGNLHTIAVCCGIWLWELVFGQVNLWQDGAINYLWSVVFLLLYLYPFGKRFMLETEFFDKKLARAAFLIFSFLVGSYSESASAAGILVSLLLIVFDTVYNHRRISKYGLLCVAVAIVGYITIYLAPGEWASKSGQMTLTNLFSRFENATWVYASSFCIPGAALVVFLVVNLTSSKMPVRHILLSVALLLGSLAANYINIFGSYYPERSATAAFILLLTAEAALLPPVIENAQWKVAVSSAMAVLMLFTLPHFISGIKDIGVSYYLMTKNERIIQSCVANGETKAEIKMIYPATKYSPIYDLKYIDVEDSTSWPNYSMALYYGLEEIIGVP